MLPSIKEVRWLRKNGIVFALFEPYALIEQQHICLLKDPTYSTWDGL